MVCREGIGPHRFWERDWRAAEEDEGDPVCSGVQYLAVEGGEEGDVRMELLCGVLKSLVIWRGMQSQSLGEQAVQGAFSRLSP